MLQLTLKPDLLPPPQPPFPRPAPQGTPDGPTLSHPALHVQTVQHRTAPGSGAHRLGYRAGRVGRAEARGSRWRGAGAKMPFEFPTKMPPRAVFMRQGEGNAFMNVSYPLFALIPRCGGFYGDCFPNHLSPQVS